MIKKIILFIFAILAITPVIGQQHYNSNIAIGVKGGTTISRTMFAPNVDQKFLTGAMFGLTFRYIEEKHFGLIAELNFQQRGWSETFDETSYKFNRKLSYIQIPLLAHIYFGGQRARFFFNAGPEIAFNIGDKITSNFNYKDLTTLPDDFPLQYRNTDQYTMPIKHKLDYGISAGLGMEFIAAKKHSIILEGRFYYGLNNIFGDRKKDVFSASNAMSIMVTLGYMFRIK